ncbi:hypothetical protein ACFY1P_00780 [Streptomyces sp. NPDC001407]
MTRHRKPKQRIDWQRTKHRVQAVTPWVELLVAIIGLVWVTIGRV